MRSPGRRIRVEGSLIYATCQDWESCLRFNLRFSMKKYCMGCIEGSWKIVVICMLDKYEIIFIISVIRKIIERY